MRKMLILIVFFQIAFSYLRSEDTKFAWEKYWTLNVFVGGLYEQGSYIPPKLTTKNSDPTLDFPTLFNVKDKLNRTKIVSLEQYLNDYGVPEGNYKTRCFWDFISEAIPEFWYAMYKETNHDFYFPKEIRINYIWALGNQPWMTNIISDEDRSFKATMNEYKSRISSFLSNDTSGDYKKWEDYNNRNTKNISLLILPAFTDSFGDNTGTQGSSDGWGSGTCIYAVYQRNVLDLATGAVAHELGHLIPGYFDQGHPGNGGQVYSGIDESNHQFGRTFSTSGIYDLMHASGALSSPEKLYGIVPFSTFDIINTKDLYHGKPIIGIRHKVIDEVPVNNFTSLRLKAVREYITEEDGDETWQVVSLPVTIDYEKDPVLEINGTYVESQTFFLEYRNGRGFDDYSAMFQEQSSSKGILISHNINEPNHLNYGYPFRRIIDIEVATPLTTYRNPDSTWVSSDNDLSGRNGKWYMGKEINDWMDDYAPNGGIYPWEGGKSTWYKKTSMHNQSLPTDFFNDTDRNKFTPSTRPNTNSWKGADTNIGIYIDKIEGDYADLRIYRNYYSIPLTSDNAKSLPDGQKGISIIGDGYIGENFYVDSLIQLRVGDKPYGYPDCNPKTTLVPGTNMHVKNGGYLQLNDDSKLRLENSKLEFRTGSKFAPFTFAGIEIENSEIIFQDGYIQQDFNLNAYIISISGTSSFYSSDFYMKGSSLVTLNSGSVFRILSGSKITFSPNSVLTLKSGSELVIEEGAVLVFEEGSKIVVEGNAKITGKIIDSKVKLEFVDNAVLTLSENSVLSLLQIAGYSMVLGNDASVAVSAGAHLILNSGTSSTFGTNSGIFVHRYGQLTINYSGLTSIGSWQGIIAEDSSTVSLTSSRIDKAVRGLYAIASNVSISKSTFRNCENGISLVNCSKSTLSDNIFAGIGVGSGISVTQSPITIYNNNVSGFEHGVSVTSCDKLTLIKNKITSNTAYGLYVTGYNSLPLLVNAKGLQYELNNEIYGNGIGKAFENGGQIFMKYSAGISMNNGYNNVYSEAGVYFPDVPCMRGASHLVSSKVDLPDKVFIKAEYNYWGSFSIDSGNYERLFDMWKPNERYYLDVYPYGKEAYTPESKYVEPSGNEPASPESILLYTAVKQEQSENYSAAIKLYEQITKKYEDTHEYYVAMSRLPYLYSETNLSTEPLLSSYDSAYDSENTSNKKFFREMQVSVHLKNNNYDSAISVAEELKATAQSEDEILLAEIDIEIANFMKNVHGKAANSSDRLNQLVSKLNGTEDKGDGQTSISEENTLPKENILYQNYPNPFNPVTQIKFALAKTADVKLSVYNISGQLVSQLASGTLNAGIHAVDFDGSRLNSGIYYYTLETDGNKITKKMVLTK